MCALHKAGICFTFGPCSSFMSGHSSDSDFFTLHGRGWKTLHTSSSSLHHCTVILKEIYYSQSLNQFPSMQCYFCSVFVIIFSPLCLQPKAQQHKPVLDAILFVFYLFYFTCSYNLSYLSFKNPLCWAYLLLLNSGRFCFCFQE